MGKPTRSAAELNAVLTSYSEDYLSRKLTNQNFTNHPLLDHLLSNAYDAPGGYEIVVPVLDGYTPAGGWVTRGSTINVTHVDHATNARYQLKYMYEPVILDWTDEMQAEGGGAMLRYVEDAIDAGVLRAYENVATATVAAATGTNSMTTVLEHIDSTGAIGGLNPATAGQTFWAAYEKASVGSFASNGASELRTAWLNVTKYKMLGGPTAIFMSKNAFIAYQASGLSLTTIYRDAGSKNLGIDIGTTGVEQGQMTYNTIPVFYEPHLDVSIDTSTNTGIILFVNNKGLRLAVKTGQRLTVEPWRDMFPGGKLARGTAIKFCGQTITQARSCEAKLTDISA